MKNIFKLKNLFTLVAVAALAYGGKWEIHDKDSIKTSFPSFLEKINQLKK